MKTSNKILLLTLAGIGVLVIVMAIISRAVLGGFIAQAAPTDPVTRTEDLKDFNAVRASAAWELDIRGGDGYSVVITSQSGPTDGLIVRKTGRTLELGWARSSRTPPPRRLRAVITLPEITALELSGASTVKLSGFTGKSLRVVTSGAGGVVCRDSGFDDLTVVLSGVGGVDFSGAKTKNADVTLSGLGAVKLNMAGGELRGDLSGLGSIEYTGEVSAERINKSGLGSVNRK